MANRPQAAIDDIARVLRPGGRAVLLEADQGTRIISDIDPDVASAFIRASLAAVANPYAARRIPAQVRRAGLTLDPDVGSAAFIFSSEMLLRGQVVQRAADDAVESGGLARDVADAAVRAMLAAAERGRGVRRDHRVRFHCLQARSPHRMTNARDSGADVRGGVTGG